MSNCIIVEHDVPITIISDDCNAEPVVITAVESTTVLIESEPEVVEINAGARGLPGTDVELQKSATHVQWRLHKDGEAWQNLIAIADLVGPPSMADAPTDGTPYARKDGAWAAAATAAQGAKADAAIPAAQKGAVNGVATLDAGGKIPESQIPALAITDVTDLPAALAAKQNTLVSGTNIKTVGGQSLLGTGNVPLGDFLYGTPDPDNGGGSDGDVYIQYDGKLWKKGSGAWTYTGIQFAADSVTLTDAAATATLPDTAAASVASRLQALRNNVKQAFADLASKAADNTVVKLTGAQTVAGVKTFTDRSSHAGAYTPSITPAHSATPTFDCAASNSFEPGVMTSNVTSLTMSNPVAGQTVQIIRKQDATGGRTHAVPSGAKIDGSINTGANRVSILVMTYYGAGSMWIGNWLQIPA